MDEDENYDVSKASDKQEPTPTGILLKLPVTDLPKDAVLLSDEQVLDMQIHMIKDWKPKREMWPFKYGPVMIASGMALTGMISLFHMRRMLFLRGSGRWTTFMASVPVPAVTGSVISVAYVNKPILLNEVKCPICLEMRACAIQLGFGIIQPIFLAVISSCTIANTIKSYYLPPFSRPLELLQEYRKLMRPLNGTLTLLLAINLLLAFKVTRRQIETAPLIHNKLQFRGSPYRP